MEYKIIKIYKKDLINVIIADQNKITNSERCQLANLRKSKQNLKIKQVENR